MPNKCSFFLSRLPCLPTISATCSDVGTGTHSVMFWLLLVLRSSREPPTPPMADTETPLPPNGCRSGLSGFSMAAMLPAVPPCTPPAPREAVAVRPGWVPLEEFGESNCAPVCCSMASSNASWVMREPLDPFWRSSSRQPFVLEAAAVLLPLMPAFSSISRLLRLSELEAAFMCWCCCEAVLTATTPPAVATPPSAAEDPPPGEGCGKRLLEGIWRWKGVLESAVAA